MTREINLELHQNNNKVAANKKRLQLPSRIVAVATEPPPKLSPEQQTTT
jgi:hypothetical protein